MDEHRFFNSAIYRSINVLAFFAYTFIILLTLLAFYFGYLENRTISETLVCKDGTRWDAGNLAITERCGLCKKREADNNYLACSTEDPGLFNSYDIEEEKEPFNRNMLVYPAVVFSLGIIVIDALKIALFYIFSGRLLIGSSFLVILIGLFSSKEEDKN